MYKAACRMLSHNSRSAMIAMWICVFIALYANLNS